MNKDSSSFTFPEVCIVEASAGSGKTYTLAKRYVRLLLDSRLKPEEIPLRNILAITFTRKAAAEMKERILEFLKKVALDRFPSEQELNDILAFGNRRQKTEDRRQRTEDRKQKTEYEEQKEFSRKKAGRAMTHLIRNYNFFQVQTIDSFINSLLSACAFKLDLSAGFRIKENYGDYLRYSLDKLIDGAGSDKKVLEIFDKFLKQYMYIENRGSWFPKKQMLAILDSLFSHSNTYGGAFERYDLKSKNLILQKRGIFSLLKKLNENLPKGTNAGFSRGLGNFLEKYSQGFDIDSLSDYFMREEFPVNKGVLVSENIEGLWEKIRKEVGRLCEWESYSAFNCYISMFDRVFENFRTLSNKEDVLFLGELNRRARLLFDKENITAAELYYRLATRFRHYLIDEFQDTSILQWKNLILMIEEALSTGGSLFYVGDKKQAIYRFRGGEVSLFDFVRERFSAFNLKHQVLSKNFRSQKEIVEFNNEIFSPANLRRFIEQKEESEGAKKNQLVKFSSFDIDEIVEVFQDAKQSYRQDYAQGFVKFEFVSSQNREERDDIIKGKVIGLIKDLRKRFSFNEFGVLTRTREEVGLLTGWFLEEGIAVESERTLNIRENFLIKELVSFLKFLNSPIDNLAFSSFILGEIFLRAAGLKKEKLREFILGLRDKTKVYFYRQFRSSFPQVWNGLIDEFFKSVGFIPLYEFVTTIMNRFAVIENFPQHQGFFMKFLELIKKQEEESVSLVSFLDFFEQARDDELSVNATGGDSVKVTTIHKSKGLEFGVVIIPFLEMDVQVGSRGAQGGVSYVVSGEEDSIRLLRLKKTYAMYSEELKERYRKEYKESFIDELNTIYVALTRAKNELYIFIPEKVSNKSNVANYLIPPENPERGRRVDYKLQVTSYPSLVLGTGKSQVTSQKPEAGNRKLESSLIMMPPSEYKDWIHILKDEFTDEARLKNRQNLLRGQLFHTVLSFIGNLVGENKDRAVEKALEGVRLRFPFAGDLADCGLTVKRLLEKPRFKPFFFIEDGTVWQEREIVDSAGLTRRIDRLIVKEKDVWVVDYKSARDNPRAHREQIKEYMRLIQDLYPGRRVKGFLIYLDDLSVEQCDHG